MKRLIKKSEYSIGEVLNNWFEDWYSVSNAQIEKIINDNNDCLYNGIGYRYIELENKNDIIKYLENQSNKNEVKTDELKKILINDIKLDDRYCSWGKTFDDIKIIYDEMNYDFGVVISANIKGLDILQLLYKYKKQIINNDGKNIYDDIYYRYSEVNEIIATLPNNFIIENIVTHNSFIDISGNTVNINEFY